VLGSRVPNRTQPFSLSEAVRLLVQLDRTPVTFAFARLSEIGDSGAGLMIPSLPATRFSTPSFLGAFAWIVANAILARLALPAAFLGEGVF